MNMKIKMTMKHAAASATLFAMALGFAAFAAANDSHESSAKDQTLAATAAPTPVSLHTQTKEQLYIGNDDAIRAGQKLYFQHCVECHGKSGEGLRNAANLKSDRIQAKTPTELVEFLRNGNLWKGMPSWAGLPEQRRWQIVAYLKSLH
jgi:mono/diheme cytochrome c family protein